MRHLGRPLDPKQLRDADEVCADVRIQHESNLLTFALQAHSPPLYFEAKCEAQPAL